MLHLRTTNRPVLVIAPSDTSWNLKWSICTDVLVSVVLTTVLQVRWSPMFEDKSDWWNSGVWKEMSEEESEGSGGNFRGHWWSKATTSANGANSFSSRGKGRSWCYFSWCLTISSFWMCVHLEIFKARNKRLQKMSLYTLWYRGYK